MLVQNFLDNFLTKNRSFVIAAFAVPASGVYRVAMHLWKCRLILRPFRNTDEIHNKAVAKIQDQVQASRRAGKKMCTARKPWKAMSLRMADYKQDLSRIRIDHLCGILEVDEERAIVRAEPMVTMADMSRYLARRGYSLAVQAEMDDLTLGGLCMGVGIETTSHREGFVFETVEAFEIVTSNGDLLCCTREQNADLFHALPWSHGTLGFLVAVEIRIIPIKSHIKLDYEPFDSVNALSERLRELTAQSDAPRFIEGLVFSKNFGAILTGDFASPPPGTRVNRINNYYKPYFYSYVEKNLRVSGAFSEYIPTRHYYHRHTPSVFFQLKDLVRFANTPVYRYLWAWMGAPKISILKFTMTKDLRIEAFEKRVAQDILVPIEDLADSVGLSDELFNIYPLWVCPVRLFDKGEIEGFLRNPANGKDSQVFVDLGIYGLPAGAETGHYDQVQTSRRLERFVRERGGYQMLYADIFMTRSEFEQMFEHRLYQAMRRRYDADKTFPDVYSKVSLESWIKESIEELREPIGENSSQ